MKSLFMCLLLPILWLCGSYYLFEIKTPLRAGLSDKTGIIINEVASKPKIYATITGYSSDPNQTDDTPEIMASNKKVYKGAIACPRNMPFGTIINIDGKSYICEDRMNLKYDGKRLDIWFETKNEAINFGKQVKEIKIIR